MRTITLTRNNYLESGATGNLSESGNPNFPGLATLECPWENNKQGVSCIPLGTYRVARDTTGKYQYYAVQDVPGRASIEIHAANWVIDPRNNKRLLEGCIALGRSHSFESPRKINQSRKACEIFLAEMGDEDFMLEIVHADRDETRGRSVSQ